MKFKSNKYILVFLLLSCLHTLAGQTSRLLKVVQTDQIKLKKQQLQHQEIKSYDFAIQIKLYQTIMDNLVNDSSKLVLSKSERLKLTEYFETTLADFIYLDSIQQQLDQLILDKAKRQSTLFDTYNQSQPKTLKAYRKHKAQLGINKINKQYKFNKSRFYDTLEQVFIDNRTIEDLYKNKDSFYAHLFGLINEGLSNLQEEMIDQQGKELTIKLEAQKDSLSAALDLQTKEYSLNIQIQKNLATIFEKDISQLTNKLLHQDSTLKIKEEMLASKLADLNFVQHQVLDLDNEKRRIMQSKYALQIATKHLSKNIGILTDQEAKIMQKNHLLHNKNKALAKDLKALRTSKKELEQTNEGIEFWLKVLTGFALLGTFIIGMSARRIYQSKQKIALAYANVEKANLLLETRTKELKAKTDALNLSHKELNHRVKNNLQQISSLIFLQEEEIEDKQAKEAFNSLQGRIDTIKIIHQKLYKQTHLQLTKVKLSEYIHDLVKYIVGGNAEIEINTPEILIEMDHATDIGLIINELVTNADKYAFPSVENPKITITIKVKKEMLHMEIRDNGLGFPNDFSLKTAKSFGLKSIVELFVYKSERSQLELFNDNGAVVQIIMPFNQTEGKLIA